MAREELHHRRIDMRAYRREDGLFEVEGRVVDRKPHVFEPLLGGKLVPAGEPLHDMGVRIVFDATMLVHDVMTFTNAAPYAICPGGGDALQALKGLRMSGGWSKAVRERLPAANSCTHLVQLLSPMATVAFQSMSVIRLLGPVRRDETGRPFKVDSCFAYGAGRDLVREHWPEFYEANGNGKGQDGLRDPTL